ncbi:hypothetical protein Scep_016863 [Stephania cephalantha]|uniref:Uncharacterized protein n=1 Tax=Stephania cephalantha TaxID=152367 RepID=A0AAP0IPE4_9MAGN
MILSSIELLVVQQFSLSYKSSYWTNLNKRMSSRIGYFFFGVAHYGSNCHVERFITHEQQMELVLACLSHVHGIRVYIVDVIRLQSSLLEVVFFGTLLFPSTMIYVVVLLLCLHLLNGFEGQELQVWMLKD